MKMDVEKERIPLRPAQIFCQQSVLYFKKTKYVTGTWCILENHKRGKSPYKPMLHKMAYVKCGAA